MQPLVDTESPAIHGDHPELAVFGSEEPPRERTLVDIFRETTRTCPDAIALESQTRTLSYAELSREVEDLAARLRSVGIGPGLRVGIRIPSGSTDLYTAILGILHAGAAYVPVDWDDPETRADTVFSEAQVAAVVGHNLETVLAHSPSTSASPQSASTPPSALPSPSDAGPHLDDDAWIIFTSGSTGKPKGVAISHRSAAALVDAEASLYLTEAPLQPGDRVMAGLSVAFDASCEEMWLAWRNGATLVAAPRHVVRSGPDLGDWIVDQSITAVSTVPTLASMWPAEALDRVRLLIFGGEACPLDLITRLDRPGRELWNTYGPTEATVIATGALMRPQPPVRIGRAIRGWRLAVIDPATGHPVRWGEDGELVIGGVGLGRYLDADKDAEKYAPLPSLGWQRAYRTGDMVTADRAGLLFAGRIDDQIKLGGKRLELGEVDTYLSELPGVNFGAAALQKTAGGSDVLVGYLTEKTPGAIDLDEARRVLSNRLSAGVAPILTLVDELPMKTSGKVDRKALPWPLQTETGSPDELTPGQAWLKDLWSEQLGPVGIGPDTNFFQVGGGSVQIARLVAQIRRTHPNAEIAELYDHPELADMSDYVAGLHSGGAQHQMPEALPWGPQLFQILFIGGMYALNGLRYLVAAITVVWALGVFFDAAWVPPVPFLPVLVAWLLTFSLPGRVAQAVIGCRLLTAGIRPGTYRRGGWTHVRLWAADRFYTFLSLDVLIGTRFAVIVHRLLGNTVGDRTHLGNMPPTSGLLSIGSDVSVERDADLHPYCIEGAHIRVGRIRIGDGVRIGARATIDPGVRVGQNCEILPGANLDLSTFCGEVWGGSPAQRKGPSGHSWPSQTALAVGQVGHWSPLRQSATESLGILILVIMPLIALTPGVAIVLPQVIAIDHFPTAAARMALWVPVVAILTAATWLTQVIVLVRILAGLIQPGFFRTASATGWAVWLTQTVLARTLISAYPIFASSVTPLFLRALGARVGKNTEISTLETIPHLTWIQDGSFIADNALVNGPRCFRGWIHLGTTVIGAGSFVGNSAIVGPDTDLPSSSLVAVFGSSPRHAPVGSSWLGGTARPIPRNITVADDERTHRPASRLKWARLGVESLRIIPFMLVNWMDLGIVVAMNAVYMQTLLTTQSVRHALEATALAAIPIVGIAGFGSAAIAIGAKWLLVGRFRERERPLFSSFVWRNELADVFAESLAVASLIKISIGSPIMNVYARLMGARVGSDVWCETWWLPEFDLIELGDRSSVNRGTVVQTHLFHDRMMSMVATRIEVGATLGVNSFMLPGSTIGARSIVGSGSLVLRDEQLPADTHWHGNPVAYVDPGAADLEVADPAGPTTGARETLAVEHGVAA